ncbi:glycoside hydrolase superfamily [Chytriomyces sp. MP71]|nr:glycoside hydrolase superfamily [Chytriomyces sp. MP71]
MPLGKGNIGSHSKIFSQMPPTDTLGAHRAKAILAGFAIASLVTSLALVTMAAMVFPLHHAAPPKPSTVDPSTRQEPCRDALLARTPLCNTMLSHEERATQFVQMLTLEEKAREMGHEAKGVERLGLAPYLWWNEALHGVGYVNCVEEKGRRFCASVFPAPLAQAATFNMDLVARVARATSDEARALHTFNGGYSGLNVWAPHINIYRDPRWGRGQETPGEDPFLTTNYALNFIKTMQEKKQGYPKLTATLKHFAVYNVEKDRNSYNAVVSKVDLYQTFLPAFKSAIEDAKAGSVMCSYNAVNGVPSCASAFLLQDVLRSSWKFPGFVVSDCGAIGDIYSNHKFNKTVTEAAAQAVLAGTDLDCGGEYINLPESVHEGLLTEHDVDRSLIRLYKGRLELGIFDSFELQDYNKFPLDTLDSGKHRRLARDGARQSFVLLKNEGKRLPLNGQLDKPIAVIGPHSTTTTELLSNYLPYQLGPVNNIVDGLRAAFTMAKITSIQGVHFEGTDGVQIDEAVSLASSAELVILTLGMDRSVEDEGHDRDHIELPGLQLQLLQRVAAASRNPVVLVVIGGGSLDLTWAQESPYVGAILYGFYPGMETASGLADVLTGAYSPAGRLPITFYPADYIKLVDLSRPDMHEGPGRTYRFYTDKPQYPFGFGLSYTHFKYKVQYPSDDVLRVANNGAVKFEMTVQNVGEVASDHSVLAFVHTSLEGCPLRQLFWFKRLQGVKPGALESLEFQFEPHSAFCVNAEGLRVSPPGKYTIVVGDGEAVVVRDLEIYAAASLTLEDL